MAWGHQDDCLQKLHFLRAGLATHATHWTIGRVDFHQAQTFTCCVTTAEAIIFDSANRQIANLNCLRFGASTHGTHQSICHPFSSLGRSASCTIFVSLGHLQPLTTVQEARFLFSRLQVHSSNALHHRLQDDKPIQDCSQRIQTCSPFLAFA